MPKRPTVVNDAVLLFTNDLAARVVAQTGRPEDRFHMGKLIMQSMKDAPDFVMQIDGATGESVTFKQGLERSVRCAIAMRNMGLGPGDVMVLMSPNYSDLASAFYAAFYLGVTIAPVDMNLGVLELKSLFEVNKPKLIFCKSDKVNDAAEALSKALEKALIVTFDQGEQFMTYSDFINKYSDNSPIQDFKANDFNPDNTVALCVTTSGTTGLPKSAASSHKNLAIAYPYLWARFTNFPTPTRMAMVCSTLQWMTALINYFSSPLIRFTRLQSSLPVTLEHTYYLINTYKPTFTIMSPTFLSNLINPATRHKCDFSSFELILIGGSVVHQELLDEAQKAMPEADVCGCFGMTEINGSLFHYECPSQGRSGKPVGYLQYRLVDVESKEEILESNVKGELWVKGPVVTKGYYNNPEATKLAFTEDRWFKTGDMFYRDENWNFYFVDRIKLLMKYQNYQISPVEIERVIQQHPGVQDVVVVGLSDSVNGELPVAFIVRRAGSDVTAQEIKDMVKSLLSDAKQLRGGVIFVDSFPITATSKVHRMKLKQMALTMERE